MSRGGSLRRSVGVAKWGSPPCSSTRLGKISLVAQRSPLGLTKITKRVHEKAPDLGLLLIQVARLGHASGGVDQGEDPQWFSADPAASRRSSAVARPRGVVARAHGG
jgi:hypothetical protein